jgi:hypothetical protein
MFRSSKAIAFLITALVGQAVLVLSANADPIAYVVGSGNEFGTMDLSTGSFTQIGSLALPPQSGPLNFPTTVFGIGFGGDGNLYALAAPNISNLYRINTQTAAVTLRAGHSLRSRIPGHDRISASPRASI